MSQEPALLELLRRRLSSFSVLDVEGEEVNAVLVLLDELLQARRGGRVAGGGDELYRGGRGEEGTRVTKSQTTGGA
jgi:hypothetical protein